MTIKDKLKKIPEQLEAIPTLIDKLKFIKKSFSFDDETCNQIARETEIDKYKRKNPLFADQAEEQIPKDVEMSGFGHYVCIVFQALQSSAYNEKIIGSFSNDPLVAYAIAGNSLRDKFKGDYKNWEENKSEYLSLIGETDPGKIRRFIFTEKQEQQYKQHPIVFIEDKIDSYIIRMRNTKPEEKQLPKQLSFNFSY